MTAVDIDSIQITALPYDEWEAMEEARLQGLEECAALQENGGALAVEIRLNRLTRELRNRKMAACVPDWPEVKTRLSTADVRALEARVDALSWPEVVAENLSATGAGQPTSAG
jgi:hypothetical protein